MMNVVFSIGDLARLGGVSVRMLRHYDEIGLLRPQRVDPRTLYRSYGTEDLNRLRRIVTFRELGFLLPEIGALLEESIDTAGMRGMLRIRRAQIAEEIELHEQRLRRIEQLIATIEQESTMPTILADSAVQRRVLPSVTVALCSDVATGFGAAIGPVLSPLFPQVFAALGAAGVECIAPPLSLYDERSDGAITVSAAAPISPDAVILLAESRAVEVRVLPEIDAITTMHVGSVATIEGSYQALLSWISDHGLQTVGYSREVNLACPDDPDGWVTEIQFEVRSADA